MFRCALLIEPFDVIRAGLSNIIRQGSVALQLIETSSINNIARTLHGQKPDLMLVPHELLPMPQKLLNELHLPQSTTVCGIAHQQSPDEPAEGYTTSISIFDSQDVWLSRLRQLKMHQNALADLTDREREVLRLLSLGLSNKEVANMLKISTHTVISHRKNIIDKTDIHSLAGLTLYAIINGVVNIDEIK